jgi:hypothetical protein
VVPLSAISSVEEINVRGAKMFKVMGRIEAVCVKVSLVIRSVARPALAIVKSFLNKLHNLH